MTLREEALLREKFGPNCDMASFRARLDGGEPFAYILGEWYFWDEVYKVTPDVLIPRPDTEHIVEAALRYLPENGSMCDLCCGSGCIGISIAAHKKGAVCLSCDISAAALDITVHNASLNGVSGRIAVKQLDVLDGVSLAGIGKFDVVTSNPPYIRTDVIPTLETVQREPMLALDGGADGLVFYRALLDAFDSLVNDGGVMILEIGYDQGDELRALCNERRLTCEIRKDYSSNDRVCIVQRR